MESMGLFNAVRRYLLHDEQADSDAAQQQPVNRKSDGIVVVGDGNTRTFLLLVELHGVIRGAQLFK